ncbi:MAG TPA: hypothetical protein PK280_18600 [Planctomycetota bacterium]|nr:hypothetical protein [Planctomycetota bacterium]
MIMETEQLNATSNQPEVAGLDDVVVGAPRGQQGRNVLSGKGPFINLNGCALAIVF